MTTWRLSTPLKDEDIAKVRVGDIIYLTGHVSTGRDDVHMRVVLDHKPLPVGDMRGGALMHAGPIVRLVSGEGETGKYEMVAIGPTTSMRMEKFEAEFIAATGCKLIIGKGGMGPKTVQACKEHHVLQTILPAGCAVLGALTFPDVFFSTGSLYSAVGGTIVALFLGYRGKSLVVVAIAAIITVYLLEMAGGML